MKKILLFVWAALCIFSSNAQPTTGLVAYWPMNGNYNNATATSITSTNYGSIATTNNAGAANTAMAYNNPTGTVAQYALHTTNSALNFSGTQDFTIACAVYFNSPYVHPCGIYDNHLNYFGYGVWMWNANGFPQVQFNYKNNSLGTTNGAVSLATWVHVLCMRNNGMLSIYINGVLSNSGSEGTQTPSYPYAGCFGGMYYNPYSPPLYNALHGKLDELRIYNRALTGAEITQTYNAWFSGTLPVKLNNFTATKTNDDVLLRWQTEYEQNSSHFNIQRSIDGTSYSNIAVVKAAGNASTISNYQYTDNTVQTIATGKTLYYRLEEVDKDDRKKLSDILLVKYNSATKLLTLLQNPVTDAVKLQIKMPAKEHISLLITNVAGQQVLMKNMVLNAGDNFTSLPISNLAKGLYTITLIPAMADKQTLPFIK